MNYLANVCAAVNLEQCGIKLRQFLNRTGEIDRNQMYMLNWSNASTTPSFSVSVDFYPADQIQLLLLQVHQEDS